MGGMPAEIEGVSEVKETDRGLFVQIPLEVLHDRTVSHAAKLAYARLLLYAGRNGQCNPAQETLAAEVCLSSRQLRTVLSELRARGWIDWKRTRTSCRYDITGPVPDRKKTAGEIGSFPPVRSEENFLQKDLRKDHGKEERPNTDSDWLPTNRKNHDSPSADHTVCPSRIKQYPLLRKTLLQCFSEPEQEDIYPSDRIVVDVMDAAGGATEQEVVACLRYLYNERGLRCGTRNGPRHWAWFKTAVADYFGRKRVREEVTDPCGYNDRADREGRITAALQEAS
jgi:hypothetical protein